MRDMILVLNFDNAFGGIVARKLRRECVYCKLVPKDISLEQVRREDPAGLILAGSVTSRGERSRTLDGLDARLLEAGLPLLALGSAARTLCEAEGGDRFDDTIGKRAVPIAYQNHPLFAGVEAGERWLEHAHNLRLPEGFVSIAEAEGVIVGFAHAEKSLFGLQFQIEQNDPDGVTILMNFVTGISKCTAWWSEAAFVERAKDEFQRTVGEGEAICAVSGGLDSTVCAMIAHQAMGDRLHCVLIDTGLLRRNEPGWVVGQFREHLSMPVTIVDMREQTLEALRGAEDTARKEAVVRGVIDRALETEAARIGSVDALIRATTYSDIVYAGYAREAMAGGRTVIEPLHEMFRDEVHRVGEMLGLPGQLLSRQPFPDAGLATRIWGEATPERLDTLRAADAVWEDEITQAGLARKLSQYYAVLAQVRMCEPSSAVLLRALQRSDTASTPARLPYDLLERAVDRILKETLNAAQKTTPGVARVMYDMTPPARTGGDP